MSDPLVPLALAVLDEPWPVDLDHREHWFTALGLIETSGSLDPAGMSYGMLETRVPGVAGMWQGSGPQVASMDLICSYGDGVAETRDEIVEALSVRLGPPTRSTWFAERIKIWISRVQDGTVTVQYSARG